MLISFCVYKATVVHISNTKTAGLKPTHLRIFTCCFFFHTFRILIDPTSRTSPDTICTSDDYNLSPDTAQNSLLPLHTFLRPDLTAPAYNSNEPYFFVSGHLQISGNPAAIRQRNHPPPGHTDAARHNPAG